jgi:hypothetical protein
MPDPIQDSMTIGKDRQGKRKGKKGQSRRRTSSKIDFIIYGKFNYFLAHT